ncbi:hypothetical protein HDIA_2635 [Hartmannibacter diazotrophicus]|uniref:DUF2497 domain-containing protein n=1 Tax=Hartmannibacter diazotrophicus TaxID=1482074 RepID=A0A2C9D7C4_9HYPH|nr:DUF2497 domain-containing protein [Hartmannibacter diazotrophicus]SON56176.1 hypothetical protein HDIA_2635 [Hartmannibacter diazotrophicus]
MEEILASIRRIISDETTSAPPQKAEPEPEPEPSFEDPSETISEDDLDKLFAAEADTADVDAEPETEVEDILDLDEVAEEEAAGEDDVLDLTNEMGLEEGPETSAGVDPFELVQGLSPEEDDLAFVDGSESAGGSELEPGFEVEDVAASVMDDLDKAQMSRAEAAMERPSAGFATGGYEFGSSFDASTLISAEANASVNAAFGSLAHTVLTNNARTLEDLVSDLLRPMLKSWLDENLPTMVERLVRAEIERISRKR